MVHSSERLHSDMTTAIKDMTMIVMVVKILDTNCGLHCKQLHSR